MQYALLRLQLLVFFSLISPDIQTVEVQSGPEPEVDGEQARWSRTATLGVLDVWQLYQSFEKGQSGWVLKIKIVENGTVLIPRLKVFV